MRLCRTPFFGALALLGALALRPTVVGAQEGVHCKDGTTAEANGDGNCGTHGGVDSAATKAAQAGARAAQRPANTAATMVKCRDGFLTTAARGACLQHRGIASAVGAGDKVNAALQMDDHARKARQEHASPPGAAPRAPAAATDDKPAGAIAECNDGTYSHAASRAKACTANGGVKRWTRS